MRLNFELIELKIWGWGEGEQKVHTATCIWCLYKNQFSVNNSAFGSRIEMFAIKSKAMQ